MKIQNISTVAVGVNPSGVAITPDGTRAYVANNNNYSISGADTVTVIDLTTRLPLQTISDPSFNGPYTVTIDAAGTNAYVTNSLGSSVSIINIESNQVTVLDGFDGPSGFVLSAEGDFAYVNNYGATPGKGSGNGTTVSIVNMISKLIVGAYDVGRAPAAMAMSPRGDFLYVIDYEDGNPGTGSLTIVGVKNWSVQRKAVTGLSGPFAIAVTPDGNYAYVTNFGSNNFAPFGTTVSVIDLHSHSIVQAIPMAIQPSGVALTPGGRFALVSNYNTLYAGENYSNLTAGAGTVNIIDTSTNQVIAPTIAVGQSPANIAIAPNGKLAVVTNYTSNTVNVIDFE